MLGVGVFPDACQKDSGANAAAAQAPAVKSEGHAGTREGWWEEDWCQLEACWGST